jgi:hypothetical protein
LHITIRYKPEREEEEAVKKGEEGRTITRGVVVDLRQVGIGRCS